MDPATHPAEGDGPLVLNEGTQRAVTHVIVTGANGSGATEVVMLEPGDAHGVSAGRSASVEVHTGAESASAPADTAPLFVLRDGRLLVAPWAGLGERGGDDHDEGVDRDEDDHQDVSEDRDVSDDRDDRHGRRIVHE